VSLAKKRSARSYPARAFRWVIQGFLLLRMFAVRRLYPAHLDHVNYLRLLVDEYECLEVLGMQWQQLIDELEATVDADERRELDGEVADRTRRELARLHLIDRLRAAAGCQVTIGAVGGEPVAGTIRRVGPDWFLLDPPSADGIHGDAAGGLLVAVPAVTWIAGLSARAVDPAAVPAVDQRLGLASVLRAAARDRRPLRVCLRDGGEVSGVVSRVGADFVDVGDVRPRRRRADLHTGAERTVPFAAIAVVRLLA
jgi:hypothetical protein